MTYQNNDIKQAIAQIQEFLRIIQINNGERPTVPIDGIYETATEEAVRQFQSQNNLSPTGIVDRFTYDLLYEKALEAEFEQSEPLPLFIFGKGQSVEKGEKSDFVMLLQIILNTLTVGYDDYSPLDIDGYFGDKTENAVVKIQSKNGLPKTGIVDKATWNVLVTNFNKYNNSNQ